MTVVRDFWNEPATIAGYSRAGALYHPEKRLLGLLKDRWPSIAMLDLGMGAGRTTSYFAELAGRYVGIDRAPSMVEYCRRRFAGRWPHVEFQVGDAADLSGLDDASFDLVLFSFNSIDYLDADGRARALREMKRVCRAGGWLVFSSHNFHSLPRQLRLAWSRNPRTLVQEFLRCRRARRGNPGLPALLQAGQGLFVDGYSGGVPSYYIKPELQVQALHDLGLHDVTLYSCLDGSELADPRACLDQALSWIYYFCRA